MAGTSNPFLPGDLVISVVGAGAPGDATNYTDNQASPITLEDISTSGVVNGTLVLPQTTTTNAQGVTESAISGEYGSSSEGSLELSGDGHSLAIAGYGVNAATYNSAEAGVTGSKGAGGTYGNSALAQTYSVPNGGTNGAPAGVTVVPRVIADVTYNGIVDTSTSLIDVDNENNPRSVATVNGSTFYISGQGVKSDTTEGVSVAPDGANNTAPTAINTATDTRTAEFYSNTLYVSADSSINKGTGNISSYGTSPTGQTTATPLPGITGKITLTAAQENSVNASALGTSVDISPENFFFANSSTLYVADSGSPKGGGLGDGGLQKWTLANGTWSLNYTLSAGLNLVPDTTADPGSGGKATTGLIGLTGTTNANGTVSLYATNATVGDLNQTYLYGITDQLSATALPTNESFSTLATAAPDTNIRGVAFAPQAATVCFRSGTSIRVARGEGTEDMAVERLVVGDRVVTASGEHRPIRWLGHRTIDCRHHPRPGEAYPVRILAHAFGQNRPTRDVWVSPGHSICVDLLGEVLIPASSLVNGTTIRQVEVDAVTYWHVELDSHDILFADNLACESYLEMGNRSFFAEAGVIALEASPDSSTRTHADFCRPFHGDGQLVDVVRSQLRAKALSLGWSLDASDPFAGLHLIVDGARVEPVTRGLVARFHVPARAGDAWLVSATARPSEIADSGDTRGLGVCVGGLTIEAGFAAPRAIDLADPLLCAGFHDLEEGARRWTAGRARLPAALWAGHDGAADDGFFLRVELAFPAMPRWIEPTGRESVVDVPAVDVLTAAAARG